ncbi:DUF6670 family protein [Acinetobacter guerrae]|uniref:DUF6670 family protein n=1 Tax=Acinetobacter guerrae TaxID=1843371 RepID=UPI00125F641D|nr:DUF6670 family protein [Acinetobacter guerrae]
MQMLMSSLEQSTRLNLKLSPTSLLSYHPPKGRFKVVYHGLILPNLPAPLHFLNVITLIGQPKIPLFYNPSLIQDKASNTASVMVAISPHQTGYLKNYRLNQQCKIDPCHYKFDQIDQFNGFFPNFEIQRRDHELELDLKIQTTQNITHFVPLKWNLLEHWSILCHCEGRLKYQNQHYEISGMGSFDYARAANIPYLPLAFYTHQVINLNETVQVILSQVRNQWNQIIFSKFYLRCINGEKLFADKKVHFHVHRVFPKITTPNRRQMYLPREFSWYIEENGHAIFEMKAQSRGDFKFGVGAGYAGSFRYRARFRNQDFEGESGYCEYIDIRPLNWQEKSQTQILADEFLQIQPCLLKKQPN